MHYHAPITGHHEAIICLFFKQSAHIAGGAVNFAGGHAIIAAH